jgi:hypothetical protein
MIDAILGVLSSDRATLEYIFVGFLYFELCVCFGTPTN